MRRALPLAAAALAAACSPRTAALRAVAPIIERGAQAFYEEPDPQLAREALASQLKLVEGLLKNDPANPRLLAMAAQGFGGYAFLFLDDAEPERAKGLYLRGRDWGLDLAGRNPALRGIESMPLPRLEAALRLANPGDVPGLFWAGYGWAGWIQHSKDSPDAVAGLPKVAALMRRVQELSPGYYFSGPDLFLGSYYSLLPRTLGGDPAKSKEHFDSAIGRTKGRFLLAKTLCAQHYAVAAQDRELFQRLNEEVLASSEDWPEARLANAAAKIKSKHLLARIDDLF